MPYRFVHAADIHLDSPLRSLALRDPELAGKIGNATRQALVNIVQLCLDEQVDALLLAGDLYDGDQTSMKTARFLAAQMRRLHEAGIRVFMIRGNHDALSKITRELTLPDSTKLFGGRADVVEVQAKAGGLAIAVHGLSFTQPQAPDSLLPKYRPPVEGAVNIGLMHTSLDGSAGHDRYAPCSTIDLERAGFDYWALGHVHSRSVYQGGRTAIVMAGIPQGRDINEAGAKSATLVTIADDRTIRIEERATSVARFERVRVDLAGVAEWGDMVVAMAAALDDTRARVPQDNHVVARLHLTGATPLAWLLRHDLDRLQEEAANRAFFDGNSSIEKIVIECRAPEAAGEAPSDALADLRRLIDPEVLGALAFQSEAQAIAEELWKQLPPECRRALAPDQETMATMLAALTREGAEDVLARLHAAPKPEL